MKRAHWMKISAAMALVAMVVLSGCKDKPGDTDATDDGTETKQITVGYSQTGSESGWRTALTGSMKASKPCSLP